MKPSLKRRIAFGLVTATVVLALVGGVLALLTGPGREFLRVQTEQVLSDLLDGRVQIAEVELVFEGGLGLRGRDVRVYPTDGGYYGMRGDVVSVELREWSLATGDLRLASLRITGFELRATLKAGSTWSFPPLRALQQEVAQREGREWQEPVLVALHGLEEVTRYLLEEEPIANVITIEQGHVHFIDRTLDSRMREGMELQHFQLRDASARLDRPWLSNRGALALSGTVVGPAGRTVDITWTGHGDDAGIHSAVEIDRFDLDVLDGYVQGLSQQADLDGQIVAKLFVDSRASGHFDARLQAELEDFVPTVVVANEAVPLTLPLDRIQGRLSASPAAARIKEMTLSGPRVTLAASGRIERPVHSSSLAHLDLRIAGADIDDVSPLVFQLPRRTVEALVEWFDRLESGTCEELSVSGTTRLSEWLALATGELTRLPRNFLMSLKVSDVTARLGDGDIIQRGGFEADWTADRMEFRRGSGIWRGEPLAEINLTVDGFSRLVGLRESGRGVRAAPTPGVPLLWELFVREGTKDTAPTRFQVEIDYLDHPILRWPVEDARVVVTPTATGSEAHILGARWGGQPIRAELIYDVADETRLVVGLEAVDTEPEPVDLPIEPAMKPEREWGRGRFRLEPHEPAPGQQPGLLSNIAGNFSLAGSEVQLSEVDLALSSAVQASANLRLDLGDSRRVGVDLTGQLTDTSCDGLGQLGGLPAGFVTGTVDAFLDFDGHLEPGQPLLTGLHGTVVASAEEGEIRQRVPLVVTMAAATDGFNPFARRESLEYDTIAAEFGLQGGVVTARRLEVEGPVRIYATGTLDLLAEEQDVDAVAGVFLLQRVREFLGKVPLVSWVMPGSNRGFVGAYFRITGSAEDPEVETMAMKTFREQLPDVISAPIDVIDWLWTRGERDERRRREPTPTAELDSDTVVR